MAASSSEDSTSKGPSVLMRTKSSSALRWAILVCASLLMLSNYYVYDVPASLKDLIRQNMGKDKAEFESMYSLFYTVYSLPNIALPFFGGIFVDRFGARVCLIAFTAFLLVGQLFFALGSAARSFPLMLLGRCIYGLGGENMSVAQSSLVAEWFRGKELAFAFGINLSCSRLGSVINNFVEPEIADKWGGVNVALFFGVLVLVVGLLCGLVMAPIDKMAERRLLEQRAAAQQASELLDPLVDEEAETRTRTPSTNSSGPTRPQREEEGCLSSVRRHLRGFQPMFWVLSVCCLVVYGTILPFNNIASSLLQERDYFRPPPPSCHLLNETQCQSPANPPVGCPDSSWYQPPLPSTVQAKDIDCSSPSYSDPGTCTEVYCRRQKEGIKQADRVMSIPYTISAVLSPFLGLAVDKFGLRAVVITLAPVLLVAVHLSLAYWRALSPAVPLVGQGLAYSAFAAVLWPSVPFTVADDRVGVAYGLTTAIQNGGLALFPLVAAAIYKAADSEYLPSVEWLFVGLALLGVACGLLLNGLDARAEHILNRAHWRPPSKKKGGGGSLLGLDVVAEDGVDVPAQAGSASPVYL